MRILFVCESYWPNTDGGAFFAHQLVLGLVSRGHTVAVWAPGRKFGHSYMETEAGSTIYREKSMPYFFQSTTRVSYFPYNSLPGIIKHFKPDVMHINHITPMGLSGIFWAKRYHIPIVATNHIMPENVLLQISTKTPFYNGLHELIWAYIVWFHNRCDYVTSPTPTAIKLLTDHGLTKPTRPVTSGVDTTTFRPNLNTADFSHRYNLPTDRPIVLYLGRVDGDKRIDLIVSAFALAVAKHPSHLLICGGGHEIDKLRRQADDLGIGEHVTLTGRVAMADKQLAYNAASIFAIASPSDLQSIVCLEAMSCGLPVLAANAGALPELCQDGINGFLFERDNYEQLAANMIKLLDDPALRHRFSLSSLKIIDEHHHRDVTFASYEEVYQLAIKAVDSQKAPAAKPANP